MEGTWSQRPGKGVVGVRNAILYRTREVNPPPRRRSLIPESLYVYLSVCSVTTVGFSFVGSSSLKDHEDRRRGEKNRKPTVPWEETALDKEDVFALR